MPERRYATQIHTTYENFEAVCPYCGQLCVFNRATDLKTFQPISFREVTCFHCSEAFCINRDTMCSAYEWFLYEAQELLTAKRYTASVLCAAQAFETLFNLYLHVALVGMPFARERDAPLTAHNALVDKLRVTVEDLAYQRLRNTFLNTVLADEAITSIAGAHKAFDRLPARKYQPPTDEAISQHRDPRVAPLLQRVKDSTVHRLRNRVVHKEAHRPTREEASMVVQEAGDILFPLGYLLFKSAEEVGLLDDDI